MAAVVLLWWAGGCCGLLVWVMMMMMLMGMFLAIGVDAMMGRSDDGVRGSSRLPEDSMRMALGCRLCAEGRLRILSAEGGVTSPSYSATGCPYWLTLLYYTIHYIHT